MNFMVYVTLICGNQFSDIGPTEMYEVRFSSYKTVVMNKLIDK